MDKDSKDRIMIQGKQYFTMNFDNMNDLIHNAYMFSDSLPNCIPDDCCFDKIFLVCNFKNG